MKKLFLMLFLVSAAMAADESRLLRFPAISAESIVFTYAGDLYTVSVNGGLARRLTAHEGFEMFARFSPDGRWLAFTGQYDGNTEVFLMPAQGGDPVRLTHTATLSRDDVSDRMGPNNIVMGWTPDGKEIVYRSRQISFNDFIGQLFQVSRDGGLSQQLPLPRGGFCSWSPDGKHLAYNRVFREFRTWKRYRGGQADDIWIYDVAAKTTENITNHPAQDIIPMWIGQRIYFISDRDENKRMNLYVYDLSTRQTRCLTHFEEYDIKFPSCSSQAIVFENGGLIYRFDVTTEACVKTPIIIANDLPESRKTIKNVAEGIYASAVSPDGKRALLNSHGEIFSLPAQNGPTRNLTATPAIHERQPQWSPDGRRIVFISDRSGEDEIYVMESAGRSAPVQITFGDSTYKYAPLWSPDGNKVLWSDRRQRLRCVDVDSRKIIEVASAARFEIRDYTWSPDSRWVAYTRPEERGMSKVYLTRLQDGAAAAVTDGWYESYQPEFSRDGKYLFLISNRDFNPIYSQTEWNHAYQDMARIYLVTLAKETPSPLAPQSDEVEVKKLPAAEKETGKAAAVKKADSTAVKVELEGISDRLVALPIPAGRYGRLSSAADQAFYLRVTGRDEKSRLFAWKFKDRKEVDLGQLDEYSLSANGKKMLVRQNKTWAIIDLPSAAVEIKEKLDLSAMDMNVDPRAEWSQIFIECWRQMRDFFYAPNMHGVDWPAMRQKYAALLPSVRHRADLTYVIGEMISELNVGHAYVGGGDRPQPKRVKTGLLGARLVRDSASGYCRFDKILRGQNWNAKLRSPLTEIGVDVQEGDYLLAVDGRSLQNLTDPYSALLNTAGKQVTLTVNRKPETAGQRDVVVVPIDDESGLYYYQWVQTNIEKVNRATGGRVGYLHVPDMGVAGLNEFVKYFYPQLQKKALIIDVRGNGGGNVSPMLIERLRREITMIEISRNSTPSTEPYQMLWGPKVCLIDEFSASDGDLFPYQFKKLNMGKLIGKRTWGGVVGIRGSLPLLDGGYLNRPEFSRYDVEGKEWVIEGVGVEPDIVVDNDPAREFEGIDDQLNKAIEVVLQQLQTGENVVPPAPPYPKK
ncbi:MAG TPA: PDZ domain-containing protein [bacterium]|nr:PDZ domain-containing protein [bacterium]